MRFFGASYDSWTLLIAALNLLVVLIAAIFGLQQIKQIGKSQRLETAKILQQVRDRNNEQFGDFFAIFPLLSTPEEVSALTEHEVSLARKVSDIINDLAELLDHRLLERKIFFDLFSTQIIRAYYLLGPFFQWERRRSGGRYGFRTEKIAKRCQIYYNIHPFYSTQSVILSRNPPLIVYKSAKASPYRIILNRIRWIFAIY
jgi:hypothetical protein